MKTITHHLLVIVLPLILTGLLTGCGGPSEPPTISEPKISAPTPQEPGEEVGISIDVSSVSGTELTFSWQADGGEIVRGDGSPAITYRTPDKPGIYNVRVTVSWDSSSVEKVTTIRVEAPDAVAESESPTDTPAPDSGDTSAEPEPTDTPEPPAPTNTPVPPTDTPTPKPTNTPAPTATPAPTNTPRPTPTPTLPPTPVPTPSIPLYDDLADGVVDGSWYDPGWETVQPVDFTVTQGDGVFHFDIVNDTSIDRWGYFYTAVNRPMQEIYMSVTIEGGTGFGGIGLAVNSPSDWYALEVRVTDAISLNSSKQSWKVIQNTPCCPSTHILGAKVDGTQIDLYVDGNVVASFPETENLTNFNISIVGNKKSILSGYVDDVWIRFAE